MRADSILISSSLKMPEATNSSDELPTSPNNPESIIVDDTQQPKEGLLSLQTPIMNDPPKHPWASPPIRVRYRGPYQDDSTYVVICGLRTVLARFLIWFNLPLCCFVGIAIATRHIDQWLASHFSGSDARVAIAFVATYIVYAVLSHTVAVFVAVGYELWWNPYARAPTLRGELGREEEIAMVKHNRTIAKRMARTFLPCL
jgi:hypothetical protein